jgi:hypothetical protein
MKQVNNNLSNDDSATRLDKNLSRLLKLTDQSNGPGKKFTESLIDGALNELKRPEVKEEATKHIAIHSSWLDKVIGWAAMIAVACGAGLVVVISFFLKMNLLLEIVAVLTIVFNWLSYLGGHI